MCCRVGGNLGDQFNTSHLQIITREQGAKLKKLRVMTGVRYLLMLNWIAGLDFQITQVAETIRFFIWKSTTENIF